MNSATSIPAIGTQLLKTAPHQTAAEVLMLVTTFFWASNIVAGKEALEGFSPLALAQLRMSLAALLFGAAFLFWRGRPKLRFTWRQWLCLGLMGFTGITLNQICFLGGLARTSVTHTGLIQAVGPIMVLLLAASIGQEVLTLKNCAGMAIAFSGVAILLIAKGSSENGAHWIGDVILLAAGGSFAVYTLLMKDVAQNYDAFTLSTLVFGLGAALLLPFCLSSLVAIKWTGIPDRAWVALGYMVAFGSVAAYLIYTFALSVLSASKAAAFAYLQPLMAVALGVWLLGEHISAGEIAGGALILLGVNLTEQRVKGKAANAAEMKKATGGIGGLPQRRATIWLHSQSIATVLSTLLEANMLRASTLKQYRRHAILPLIVLNHAWEGINTRCIQRPAIRSRMGRMHRTEYNHRCSTRSAALTTPRHSGRGAG